MRSDIRPPQKREKKHEENELDQVSPHFSEPPEDQERDDTEKDINKKQKRKLETPKYLLIVLLVVALQNYSEIKNFFQNTAKNNDIVYASPLPETLRSEIVANQDRGLTPKVTDNHLVVPVLNIDAPIQWSVEDEKSKTDAALLNGVVQLSNSSLPGQTGNIYITGHSSNYAWEKSNYNTIFGHLDKMENDDLIYLKYNDKNFVYKVTDKKILSADDLSLVDQNNSSIEQLSLVTCWPVGTSDKRLAVLAKRIN